MTYDSIDAAWVDILLTLLGQAPAGSRDGDAREVIGHSFTLGNPSRCWVSNERRALSPYYAAGEVLWYISGSDKVKDIVAYAPQYERFGQHDGVAYGAYGARLFLSGCDLLSTAVECLRTTPNTRRCVVSLWRWSDLVDGHGVNAVKDVPCTLNWQFLLRDSKLHMVVTMRSNDIWLGVPYDCLWACTMQRVIANELGVGLGTYTHNAGSMHLYERNVRAAEEAVTAPFTRPALWVGATDKLEDLKMASNCERKMRLRSKSEQPLGRISRSLYELCRAHIYDEPTALIDPALMTAQRVYKQHRATKTASLT